MQPPLDVIEHLARSDHRAEVLSAVRSEPRTREEIRELVDASRVTVGRIVTDLEERGWISRTSRAYEATPEGSYIFREFERLVDNLDAARRLPPVYEWLPGDEPTVDLRHLAEADVVTAADGDIIAPMRRAVAFIEEAEHLRAVANGAAREFTEVIRAAVAAGQRHELVLPPETIAAIRDDEGLAADVRAILASEHATIYRYTGEGDLPVFQIGDGAVAICRGDHQAMVACDDERVRAWAEEYFELLRAEATAVTTEALAGGEPADADRPYAG